MLSLQTASINGPELDTPEPYRFTGDDDSAFSQEIFDIPVTQIEAIVEPNGVIDDVVRESVSCVGIHLPMLSIWAS